MEGLILTSASITLSYTSDNRAELGRDVGRPLLVFERGRELVDATANPEDDESLSSRTWTTKDRVLRVLVSIIPSISHSSS